MRSGGSAAPVSASICRGTPPVCPYAIIHSSTRNAIMIAGLPWTAWLLIVASIAPPLALVGAFYWAHRSRNTQTTDQRR